MKAQGEFKGELNESQGGPSGLNPLRKDGSQGSQGEAGHMRVGQRRLKGD